MKIHTIFFGVLAGFGLVGCATEGTVYVDDGPSYSRSEVYYRSHPQHDQTRSYSRGTSGDYRSAGYRTPARHTSVRHEAPRQEYRTAEGRSVKKASATSKAQKHQDDSKPEKKHKK
jgi:hypothetical protein